MSIKPVDIKDLDPDILDETIAFNENSAKDSGRKTLTVKESMKQVINYLKNSASVTISTPFQGTNLQVTKDNKSVVFSSRAQGDPSGIQAARLAVCDLLSEEVVLDLKVSPRDIWTVAISPDSQYVYAGGAEMVVYKCLLADLTKIDTFEGHQGDINKVIISNDNQYMFSASDDGTVRMWNINQVVKTSRVLFSSQSALYAMDLSFSGTLLCAGGSEGLVYIYELSISSYSTGSLLNTIQHGAEIWSMKISPKGTFLAFGDNNGTGLVYSLSDYSLIKKLQMNMRISDLEISQNEDMIVGSSRDKTINIWYLSLDKQNTYTSHSEWVKRAAFIENDTKIVSIGDDKKIKVWKIPEPSREKLFYEDSQKQIVKLWISPKNGRLEGILQSNSSPLKNNAKEAFFVSWNKMGKMETHLNLGCNENCFFECNSLCTELLLVYYASESEVVEYNGDPDVMNVYIAVFDLVNKVKIRSSISQMNIKSLFLAPSSNFFLIGEDFKFSIFNFADLMHMKTIFAVSKTVITMISDSTDTKIFISSPDTLKKYELDLTNTEEPVTEIDYITFDYSNNKVMLNKPDNSHYLFIITDYFFKIIHSNTFIVMLNIDQRYNGMFFNLNNTLFLYSDDRFEIFSSKSFQKLSELSIDYRADNVLLSYTKRSLFLQSGDKIYKNENPLCSTNIKLVCNDKDRHSIYSHINSIFNKECESAYLDSIFLIEPIHINILHIYAYYNMHELLQEGIIGLNNTRVPVINSAEEYSALSISIFMNYPDCVESIIKSIRKVIKQETENKALKQLLFQVIEESNVELLSTHYSGLHKLFMNLYTDDFSGYLPNFCPPNYSLPMVIQTDNFFPKMKEFGFIPNEDSLLGPSVIFKKSLAKFYLTLGSSKSLEFMRALEDCENEEIFETELIQLILQNKWSKVRWFMYTQAFIYICYLILLCLYTSYDTCRTSTFLIFPFAVSLLLYLYELIFVYLGICTYFSDFWNVVDTFRSFMMISYTVLVWVGYFDISLDKNEKERYMLAVLIFISWMRGITYFRINAATRYLIKLLFEVCADIVAFLIILFYSTVAIALVFRAFDSDPSSEFFDFLTNSYMIIIGNWDNPTEPEFYSIILLIATMLNPIISLNLLIAILSDTFARVQENEIVADAQEMASMIVEIETLIFCNRKKNDKKFVHVMNSDSVEVEQEEDLKESVKKVRSKVNYLNFELKNHELALDKLVGKVQESANYVKMGFNTFLYNH